MNQSNSEKSMRQRMLAGELYLASDPELVELLARSQRILHRFNLSFPDATLERESLIQELFGKIGAGSEVKPPFRCDYGFNIFAGERLFINYDCVILDCNRVQLGDRVLIGPKVQIYTATHPLNPTERQEGWESALPVEIGSDVWIGGGAIICPGVTIGEGSTIGAGSVVTRDVPPRVVAAGNPCRVIRAL
ncbi:sugar O-acetyltransferase [Oscillatoria sp. HE19RPO]|uniref:sugar O-acetyltransferase n=1 Tax=Oscillatoria sp. HE19RPO TaxID=2954806 RepID=UPI0020C21C74|nr:sugar O-acetyltransferase [Oscillatoria sp. HE19RPO]